MQVRSLLFGYPWVALPKMKMDFNIRLKAMNAKLPSFPHHDARTKVIALLGYTGVGKTSLITAGYFKSIIHSKDAFTKKFFQRMEDELRTHGEIPLTLGEASTLNFIEPDSRNEFTLQDFSGEHIKLERKEEEHYQNLLERANQADALICLLSASNFYQKSQINEEVDAIQTFVNKIRGLGTRIPIVVVLTKCDIVPRFYTTIPVLRSFCHFFSRLPFMSIPAEEGLALTQKRFPKIFQGFDFRGKGPKTVFLGMALPRLNILKSMPRGFKWLNRASRILFSDPKWLFQNSIHLENTFHFCFQAIQVSILRDLLVYHHKEEENSKKLLEKFSEELVEKQSYGKQFYFHEYLSQIVDDTKNIITEVDKEVANLSYSANRLLKSNLALAQNLEAWLLEAEEKIRRFQKPWSEGAKQTLLALRRDTLSEIRERLHELVQLALEDPEKSHFYEMLETLKLHRDVGHISIWQEEEINLPDVSTLQNQLLNHLVRLTAQRKDLSLSLYEEDRNKYKQIFPEGSENRLSFLDDLVECSTELKKSLNSTNQGTHDWGEQVLPALRKWENSWVRLQTCFSLSEESNVRQESEKAVLQSLEDKIKDVDDFPRFFFWASELKEILRCLSSQEQLAEVISKAEEKSQNLLQAEIQEIKTKAQKIIHTGRNLPEKLKEWLQECHHRKNLVGKIAGEKGSTTLKETEKDILLEVKKHLQSLMTEINEGGAKLAFWKAIDILYVCQKISQENIYSDHALTLPPTVTLEKEAFSYLVTLTLEQDILNHINYQEDQVKFKSILAGSPPPALVSLDAFVSTWLSLQKNCQNVHSHPVQEWERLVLLPMRELHRYWQEIWQEIEQKNRIETTSETSLSQKSKLLQQIETEVTRSLQEQLQKVKLEQLRDWIRHLRPLLSFPENQKLLDEHLENAQTRIRKQFQDDLQDFITQCQTLATGATKISPQEKEISEEYWQRFLGSVQSLEISTEKFPYAELTLDEKTFEVYNLSAPNALKNSLNQWVTALEKSKLLSIKKCQEIIIVIDHLREIFRRPQTLQSLRNLVEQKEKDKRQKRKHLFVLVGLLLLSLIIFDKYQAYSYEKREILGLNQFRSQLVSGYLETEDLERWERKLEDLTNWAQSAKISLIARENLLELRAFQWKKGQEKKDFSTEENTSTIERLKRAERGIQKENPLFKSHLLREALKEK